MEKDVTKINMTEDSVCNTSEIIRGRTFPNCNHKGRIIKFREPKKPFNKATPINEDS